MQKRLTIFALVFVICFVLLTSLLFLVLDVSLLKSLFRVTVTITMAILIWFMQWIMRPMRATENLISMLAGENIAVRKTSFGYLLSSDCEEQHTGLIFYPGGRVTPISYTPLLLRFAERGYRVHIARMPLNLAVLDYKRGLSVIEDEPHIKRWVIGGHSLGGAMAAHLVSRVPDKFAGLFLWGAYPSRRDDLSALNIPVLMIFGGCDGITTVDKIERNRCLFPEHTQWLKLEGGNHAQFGCYGSEPNDQQAHISPHEQQHSVTGTTLEFVEGI